MSEHAYGTRGIELYHGACPRCRGPINSHKVSSCEINKHVVTAAENVMGASKAIAQHKSRWKDIKRGINDGSIRQKDIDDTADRMVGALQAKTNAGGTIRLIATSGSGLPPGVHNWEPVNAAVPSNRDGWIDIKGNEFKMPDLGPNFQYGKPCAAIKLLLSLGEMSKLNRQWKGIKEVQLYEEACRAEVRPGKKSKRLAGYRGASSEFPYAAQSCPACIARIPALLCDRADPD